MFLRKLLEFGSNERSRKAPPDGQNFKKKSVKNAFSITLISFFKQKAQRYLPSYETISFAVKSVAKQFEWKEAVLFASGKCFISLIYTKASKF